MDKINTIKTKRQQERERENSKGGKMKLTPSSGGFIEEIKNNTLCEQESVTCLNKWANKILSLL